jgi:thiamine-monophosphate kinase
MPRDHEPLGEFEIIARYFAPLATDPAGHGLRDDAASFSLPPGEALVVTTDALVETVHFMPADPPDSIGYKALAVNLSDLAAKGAKPLAYLLNLCLPSDRARSAPWLESFVCGLHALQQQAGIALIGGDTTAMPGPLTIAITALGSVAENGEILRSGAAQDDVVFVSGSIGDAVLGLKLLQSPDAARRWRLSTAETDSLIRRYRMPLARFALAPVIRRHAHAAIDISDGLVADLGKLCAASGVGARIEAARIPLSAAARKAVAAEPELVAALLTGGDDYEVLACLPPDEAAAFEAEAKQEKVPVTRIGGIGSRQAGLVVADKDGRPLSFAVTGYTHFRSAGGA